MSLRSPCLYVIPEETLRVARAAFPKGTLAMQIYDALGPLFTTAQFAALFSPTGQPAEDPARLTLVLVLPFSKGSRIGRRPRPSVIALPGSMRWAWS